MSDGHTGSKALYFILGAATIVVAGVGWAVYDDKHEPDNIGDAIEAATEELGEAVDAAADDVDEAMDEAAESVDGDDDDRDDIER